ncbi:MAG: hypothetical protein NVSMB69_00060 [Novosphingobium sp.]
MFVMLHCFFDDSGTHGGSRIAVWGGLVGVSGHFFELGRRWRELLAEPLPDKPRLSKFGLGDCRWGLGEFQSYKPAERDRVRYLFRQAILDSGMRPFSFAVDVQAWNKIVTGDMREAYACGADGVAFSGCTDLAITLSSMMPEKSQMACVFDKGQRKSELQSLLADAEGRAAMAGTPIVYTFAPVSEVTGLQAADTIATEHYWYGLNVLDGKDEERSLHLMSLISRVKTRAYILQRPQILSLRRSFRSSQKARICAKDLRSRPII